VQIRRPLRQKDAFGETGRVVIPALFFVIPALFFVIPAKAGIHKEF
jgi:hypothetical protein